MMGIFAGKGEGPHMTLKKSRILKQVLDERGLKKILQGSRKNGRIVKRSSG